MSATLRQAAAMLRLVPIVASIEILRWCVSFHAPLTDGDDEYVCRSCKGNPPWPCAEFARLSDSISDLETDLPEGMK